MDSISTHGICGFWSVIALGVFDSQEGIIYTGKFTKFGIQLGGAASLMFLSLILSFLFFYPLKTLGRLRLTKI